MIILYVADQNRSTQFYETILDQKPLLNVPGMTEFLLSENIKLGIMTETGISRIICPAAPDPSLANGIPRCELYMLVSEPESTLNLALSAGATLVSHALHKDWGDTSRILYGS